MQKSGGWYLTALALGGAGMAHGGPGGYGGGGGYRNMGPGMMGGGFG